MNVGSRYRVPVPSVAYFYSFWCAPATSHEKNISQVATQSEWKTHEEMCSLEPGACIQLSLTEW